MNSSCQLKTSCCENKNAHSPSNGKPACCSDNVEPDASKRTTEVCCDNLSCCSEDNRMDGCCKSKLKTCCSGSIDQCEKRSCKSTSCSEKASCCDETVATSASDCCASKNCCSTKIVPLACCNANQKQPITCLAVIRPDHTSIVIFDAKGTPKSFRSDSAQLSKLCFSSHDAGPNVDGMLMHCFDSKGVHGVPLEDCVCGVEEPHLHAHIHSDMCDGDIGESTKKKRINWRFLSQVTLHLDKDDVHNVPINPSMPKECNSAAMKSHLQEQGLVLAARDCCDQNSSNDCEKHRKYKINHGDHTDYLVHDEESGGLHLEHPCGECGENDIHGRFHLMHTRSWLDDNVTKNDHKEFRVHFFQEPHAEPFRLMDAFSQLFELESSRVHAVRVVDDLLVERRPSTVSTAGETKVGRSQLFVEKICCASETRQIQSLLKVTGVVEVLVNTTTKIAYVDHDPSMISADDIAGILNAQKFGAYVKKDCAVELATLSGIPTDVIVVSKFRVEYELRVSETNDRSTTLDVITACVKERFPKEGEVASLSIDSSNDVLIVEHNPYYLTAKCIANALDSYGYEISIECDGGADGLWALAMWQSDVDDSIEHHKSNIRPTVILSGILWIVSMLSLIGGNWEYLKYVAILSVAFGLPPIAVKAFATLRRFHFDVNCMMLFAVLGALALQDFEEAAAVTFLFAISEALESKCTSRARNALASIISLRPEHANLINPLTQEVCVLPASAVAVGSAVKVKPGDKIPADGVIMEGTSTVDESSLTGESRPVSKSVGMPVAGGTINSGTGMLVVKTTATSEDSAVARLIRLVEEAQINRSDTEKMVDRFAKVYTPFVILAALLMATIPWAFGREAGQFWLHNALVTIVIACPCALVISTPVVYVAGLTASAQRGVIVKGGQHLESLGRVKAISFDKTGTLSQGVFQLLHFQEIGRSRKEALSLLALMESSASHPLADAIVKGAANEEVQIPTNIEAKEHTLLAGEGITAMVEDKRVYVGNKKLFQRIGLYESLSNDTAFTVDAWSNEGSTTGFIGIEGEGIIGAFCVADKIRDEAKSVVSDLTKMGIEISMLTGDLYPAALCIGTEIGLEKEHIKSELLPEDKLNEISSKVAEQKAKEKCWKSKRTVLMVGDGVNDAPSLAMSDVSVAMGEGSSLAMDTSDIILMDSNLTKLLYVVRMGRRVIQTIFENIFISLFLKALVVGLLFAGYGSLWAAIVSDVGAMLIVTLNGMKLLPFSHKVDVDEAPGKKGDDDEV